MKIDGVFSGGGVKAFAFIGALEVLEENQLSFERVAGSSAGAIVSSMLVAGYTSKELKKLFLTLNLNQFMDTSVVERFLPIWKWLTFYFTMGLYKGDQLETWLYQTLAKKNVYTFADIPKDSLKVIAADLSLGKIVVLPDDLPRLYNQNPDHFLIAKAIRMSAGLPYFFRPKKMVNINKQKSVIVDGAVLSSLPMWVFNGHQNDNLRPILGLQLTANYSELPENKIKNALDLSRDLIHTMRVAHDARYIAKKHQQNVLFLPVTDIKVADLNLSFQEREKLISLGRQRTRSFLKQWPI